MKNSEAEARLKAIAQDAVFMGKLVEAARLYGWTGDYIEIDGFVRGLFDCIDKEPPDLEPYEIEDD